MPVRIKDLKFIDMWGESLENQVLAYEQEPIRKGEIVEKISEGDIVERLIAEIKKI